MKQRISALLIYSVFWILFFFLARFLFLIINYREATEFSIRLLAETFVHGIRLDISVTAYLLAIPMFMLLPSLWISGSWYRLFLRIYTWIMLFFSAAIITGDAQLYSYWGFRMDYTPLLYLKTPKEVAASVSNATVILSAISVITITCIFGMIYNKLVDKMFSFAEIKRLKIFQTFAFLIFFASLIIPVRGGFGLAPINAGTVYFSDKLFVNHSAINVVWNVGNSLFHRKPTKNPYTFGDIKEAEAITDSLTTYRKPAVKILKTSRPNLLFIILESFGSSLIGPLGGDSLTTPNLNRLANEGLLFSGFYASGNRTDKALPAILSAYPAQPAVSIIKEPKKTQSMNSLVRIMESLGYHTSFWYGGDINFANFNSYLLASGFSQIISMDDFDPSDFNSKWGVHDHIFLRTLQDSMAVIREPFFRVALTLSSHEPFDVPMEPVFQGKDELTKFKNSVYYTDKHVGAFIDWAKTTDWWDNTLVILVADHCRRNTPDDLVYSPEIFRIPMLWLGGALARTGIRYGKLGSQVDISLTLLNQLDVKADFPFAKDLLSEDSRSFAFYTFNEGFAFLTDSSAVIYDQKAKALAESHGSDPGYAEKLGKAYLQVLFDDYLKK